MSRGTAGSSSRLRILQHLKRVGEASVADLSAGLGLTPVTIRHHLEALQEEGLVGSPSARRKSGPGRPELIYRASAAADQLMPRNYGELCGCLLQAIGPDRPAEDLRSTLELVGSELGRSERPASGLSGVKRFLEQRGYFPSVQRAEQKLTIRLANCPYLELAQSTPALCHFDRALLSGLLDAEVKMGQRIVNQHPVCTFEVTG